MKEIELLKEIDNAINGKKPYPITTDGGKNEVDRGESFFNPFFAAYGNVIVTEVKEMLFNAGALILAGPTPTNVNPHFIFDKGKLAKLLP